MATTEAHERSTDELIRYFVDAGEDELIECQTRLQTVTKKLDIANCLQPIVETKDWFEHVHEIPHLDALAEQLDADSQETISEFYEFQDNLVREQKVLVEFIQLLETRLYGEIRTKLPGKKSKPKPAAPAKKSRYMPPVKNSPGIKHVANKVDHNQHVTDPEQLTGCYRDWYKALVKFGPLRATQLLAYHDVGSPQAVGQRLRHVSLFIRHQDGKWDVTKSQTISGEVPARLDRPDDPAVLLNVKTNDRNSLSDLAGQMYDLIDREGSLPAAVIADKLRLSNSKVVDKTLGSLEKIFALTKEQDWEIIANRL